MKNSLIIILLLFFSVKVSAQARFSAKDSARNTFKKEFLLNPFTFFISGFEVGYGRVFNNNKENFRILFAYYISENSNLYPDEASNLEAYKIDLQYLFTRPVQGSLRYYLGGFLTYRNVKLDITGKPTNYVAKGSSASFGVIMGARSYLSENFFMDLYFGGGPTVPLNSSNENDVDRKLFFPVKRAVTPRAGLLFGISF